MEFGKSNISCCRLTQDPSITEIAESDPLWNFIGQYSYIIEIQLTRRVFKFFACLHGYSMLNTPFEEKRTSCYEASVLKIDSLDAQLDYLSKYLALFGVHLHSNDIEHLANYVYSNTSDIGLDQGNNSRKKIVINILQHWTKIQWSCTQKIEPLPASYSLDDEFRTRVEDTWSSWVLRHSENSGSENRMFRVCYVHSAGDKTCSVCLNDFEEGEEIATTSCSHNFHQICISKWVSKRKNCPLCRKRVHV